MADLETRDAAALAACAAPAAAGVMVVGSSDARLCYEAADLPLNADRRATSGAATTRCCTTICRNMKSSRPM